MGEGSIGWVSMYCWLRDFVEPRERWDATFEKVLHDHFNFLGAGFEAQNLSLIWLGRRQVLSMIKDFTFGFWR